MHFSYSVAAFPPDTAERRAGPPGSPFALTCPALSVVLVNYRSWDDTARLVHQLNGGDALRSGLAEVVIVDNHSPPHPLAGRLRRTEGVSLRRWGRNRGFARAVNEGARLSRGGWLLLLNPDLDVGPSFLDDVCRLMERVQRTQPNTGIIGLGVRNDDGSRQASTGPRPTLFRTLARLVLPRAARKYHLFAPRQGEKVAWATGCALLIRRSLFEELGGLDPAFFLYYEDVDFCVRARQLGWEVRYEPHPQAAHLHPLHSRRVPPHLRLIARHSLLTYAFKHWPHWQASLLSRVVGLESWVRQRRALRGQDRSSAEIFHQLASLCGDLRRRQPAEARKRLNRVVARWESRQRPSQTVGASVRLRSRGEVY